MTPMTGVFQKSKKKRFIKECVVKKLRHNPVMPVTPVIATIKYFITTNTITKIKNKKRKYMERKIKYMERKKTFL